MAGDAIFMHRTLEDDHLPHLFRPSAGEAAGVRGPAALPLAALVVHSSSWWRAARR